MNTQNLTIEEQETQAYAVGDTATAELLGRIIELESELNALQNKLDDMPTVAQLEKDALDLENLKEFFYDCFNRLAGHYPCPEWTSDYDKSVIFAAIEKSEGGEL
jgi:hypothetical protein